MAGRGGAGNILQAANVRITHDLEAGRGETPHAARITPSDRALPRERTEQAVALAGRGGAGNAYSPSELSKTGTYKTEGTQATHLPRTQPAPRMQGRGGAGNYGAPLDASGSAVDGADASDGNPGGEALRRQATEDVEKGLPRPDRAYLGPRRKEKEGPTSHS